MKIFSVILAMLTALPPPGWAQEAVEPSTSAVEAAVSTEPLTGPFTVTAPRINEKAALETARTAGAGAAVAGTGLMAYAVLFAAGGPVVWAAALIFAGGMTAYLSHRRLNGKQDFAWGIPPEKASSDSTRGGTRPAAAHEP